MNYLVFQDGHYPLLKSRSCIPIERKLRRKLELCGDCTKSYSRNDTPCCLSVNKILATSPPRVSFDVESELRKLSQMNGMKGYPKLTQDNT